MLSVERWLVVVCFRLWCVVVFGPTHHPPSSNDRFSFEIIFFWTPPHKEQQSKVQQQLQRTMTPPTPSSAEAMAQPVNVTAEEETNNYFIPPGPSQNLEVPSVEYRIGEDSRRQLCISVPRYSTHMWQMVDGPSQNKSFKDLFFSRRNERAMMRASDDG